MTPTTGSSEKNDVQLEENLLVFWDHGGKAHMLHIQHDGDTPDPRKDMDHFTTMACFHPRHALGDEGCGRHPGTFWARLVRKNVPKDEILQAFRTDRIRVPLEPDEELTDPGEILEAVYDWIEDGDRDAVQGAMELLKGRIACLPLWLYDHSGLTMSCGERTYPYNDQFDSSAVGWIVALKSDVLKELGLPEKDDRTKIPTDWEAKALEIMKAEVDTYDRWLRGDTWAACHHESESAVGHNEPVVYPAKTGKGRQAVSGSADWNDGEWTGGFYGDGLLDSGIAESIGCGLPEAVGSGAYWTGAARPHQITVWDYVRDDGC